MPKKILLSFAIIVLGAAGLYLYKKNSKFIDEQYAATLVKEALSLPDPVTAKVLSGGFSGAQLFTVTTDTKKYAVRFLRHKPIEERRREISILHIASEAGYGPHVYFADIEEAVVIMEFVEQKNVWEELVQSDKPCRLLAKFLQKLHHGPNFEMVEDRNIFNDIHRKTKRLEPQNIGSIPLRKMESITDVIFKALTPHLTMAPCHQDLQPLNVLFLGDTFKAIDYEGATQGDPYFDVATVAIFYCIKPGYENVLLSSYLERQPTEIETAKLYLMKQIVWISYALRFFKMIPEQLHLYEKIQVPSYIDFVKEMANGKINLEEPETKLKYAKVMINLVLANAESPEFNAAIKLLNKQ